jgi:hypothetical protein
MDTEAVGKELRDFYGKGIEPKNPDTVEYLRKYKEFCKQNLIQKPQDEEGE